MPKRDPVRLAMWSGPRNISTAMMRSWGNRPDTFVRDEPLYAHYLQATGREHPDAAEVIANGETDWHQVVEQLTGAVPQGKRVFYQKQMTHHLLPEIDRELLGAVTNCFLIRDPAEVIVSYIKKNNDPALEDLGFVQQAEIFDWVRAQTGAIPPVIDARDVLENPEKTLRLLCHALRVQFMDEMLSWPPGLRETDGIWAKHWYGEVATSSTFRKPSPHEPEPVPKRLLDTYMRCRDAYERLRSLRLR
jgi:Sulfotransferase domain